jgi:ribosomal protein S18 acetylase RimI-like enzyme
MGRSNYVLEVAGNVLGWVSVGPSRDDDADENIIGELYGIYLDPQFYRIGYGTKLWREAKQYLFRNGFNKITLWVLEENVRARRFYEKIGFILEKDAVKELDWLDGAKEVRYRYNIV